MDESRKPVNGKTPLRPMGKMSLPEPETYDNIPGPIFDKVGILAKIWTWANGKKTVLGILASTAGLLIPGGWGLVLKAVGFPLLGIGGGHKILKVQTKYGASGQFGREELSKLIADILILFWSLYSFLKKRRTNGRKT